jgi:transcriptional regulator with XRE-family HTH domain
MALTILHAVAARTHGAEIRRGRLANGWTQKQAAESYGCTIDLYVKWEHGFRDPPPAAREHFAQFWGLDRERLGLAPETACPRCGQRYG